MRVNGRTKPTGEMKVNTTCFYWCRNDITGLIPGCTSALAGRE